MNTEEFDKRRSEISDDELIILVDEQINKLCETGGKSFTMSVPVKITDTDMLLCEIVKRFREKNKRRISKI